MYPLNTILTFTSLTHASAAADLFGEDALESLYDDYGLLTDYEFIPSREWFNGFHLTFIHSIYGHVVDIKKWRIILDTPEKVKWFEPQGGDFVQDFDIGGLVTKIRDRGVDYETYHETNFNYFDKVKILLRDGHPFPQPQDVKPGETV
jgi:hypothetical protein